MARIKKVGQMRELQELLSTKKHRKFFPQTNIYLRIVMMNTNEVLFEIFFFIGSCDIHKTIKNGSNKIVENYCSLRMSIFKSLSCKKIWVGNLTFDSLCVRTFFSFLWFHGNTKANICKF